MTEVLRRHSRVVHIRYHHLLVHAQRWLQLSVMLLLISTEEDLPSGQNLDLVLHDIDVRKNGGRLVSGAI